MSRPRRDRPHPVALSLRLRAIAREREIDKAWKVLEHHGFPVDILSGISGPGRRGRLPVAMRRAFASFGRERHRAEKLAAKLAAMLARLRLERKSA